MAGRHAGGRGRRESVGGRRALERSRAGPGHTAIGAAPRALSRACMRASRIMKLVADVSSSTSSVVAPTSRRLLNVGGLWSVGTDARVGWAACAPARAAPPAFPGQPCPQAPAARVPARCCPRRRGWRSRWCPFPKGKLLMKGEMFTASTRLHRGRREDRCRGRWCREARVDCPPAPQNAQHTQHSSTRSIAAHEAHAATRSVCSAAAPAHLPSSARILTAQGSVAISSRPSPGICESERRGGRADNGLDGLAAG